MYKNTEEIRQAFLDFFQNKGHQVVASSSLVPINDPTLLFTNAGMNQFKDVFLGVDKRTYTKAATAQRCVRAGGKHNDLENVGYTARHHTFFEMLGNFSFGDYFKAEAIQFAWEFLTSSTWLNLPQEKLWITVYADDNEAYDIWAYQIGIPRERIIRIGDNKGAPYASDNFWLMGDTGPCGPSTEIFYDHGDSIWGGPPGSQEADGDRYIEIWNLVFMQFNRQLDGTMLPLPKPSVDTGMGLERIAAVLQKVHTNYQIDLFQKLIVAVAQVTNVGDLNNHSLKVIADHIRACAFLITDGVMPSNENRGYVLRRIIRRAVRHGYMLGAPSPFFYRLVAPLIEVMGKTADTLKSQQDTVEQILKIEEEQFSRTLERGLTLLDEELSQLQGDTLDGAIAFRLYDTYGFPLDLTADVCRERNIKVDEIGFSKEMENQRRRAREASVFSVDYSNVISIDTESRFCGYENLQQHAKIISLLRDGKPVEVIHAGEEVIVVLDNTPFYPESGGQIGDRGLLKNPTAQFNVINTQKIGAAIGHLGQLVQGSLKVNDLIDAQVDPVKRARICLNHSATHLLHAALREILGEHVVQKGSLVNDTYLRFDFSHFESVKPELLRQIEDKVNQQIRRNLAVQTEIMDIESAKVKGAMALFGEKYEQQVRVLTMGDFSIELCGGTHAKRTGDIGLFAITSESGVAAGIRRIEALTGENALTSFHEQSDLLHSLSQLVKSDSKSLNDKIYTLIERNRVLEKEIQHLKNQQITQKNALLLSQVVVVGNVNLLVNELAEIEPKTLRVMVDDLKNQLGSGIIVLASVDEKRVNLVVGVTKDLTDRIKAGELIAFIANQVGGKGGGRTDLAQAGGNDPSALPDALRSVEAWVMAKL